MQNTIGNLRRAPVNVVAGGVPALCAQCDARHIGLCDALPDDDLHFLASVARQARIEKGRGFVTEGDPARQFFNINHGTAKLFKDLPDGRRQITGFAGAGDFIGLAANATYMFGAEALETVQLCSFDRGELRAVFARFPAIERRLLDVASHELIIAQEQMLLLGRKTAVERVASFLDGWGLRVASCQGAATRLDLPMTRNDLAEYLGLTVETISRALATLRKQGVVAVGADHVISVIDPARLAAIGQAEG
ncbi:helix-turn-helix domain-containing protein [Acidiphilium sp. PA]|uniref:Crp/Fnr family transcriptional regulator n=1 Tax=Acidiphilium sp. PA TaxID=2871705 RepID=UPI00224423BE|nr:helix-turn-helix domain-containing protein [Acidiphilium sp. PA]MCW8308008.1 helix-turn-helix domain-containing protein [Acidiphilium sp. PA]